MVFLELICLYLEKIEGRGGREFLTLLHTMNHDFAIEYIIVKYLDLIGGLPNFPFFLGEHFGRTGNPRY